MTRAEVTGLAVYPVKGMRGIAQSAATLTGRGLLHDRRWMVVRADGRFVTQRDLHALCLVETRLDANGVVLSRLGRGSVSIAFDGGPGEPVHTRVWKDDCETVAEGPEVSAWLSAALESTEPLKLVRMAPGFVRPQRQPETYGAATDTLFADASPFLVASEDSLAELNRVLWMRGIQALGMERFRPNIVIRGLAPFAEQAVEQLAGPGYVIGLCAPCERCVVTTIDQATAVARADQEPIKTLRAINPMPGGKPAPAFAMNAILAEGPGLTIRVGDALVAD